jgi:hypothetical protein
VTTFADAIVAAVRAGVPGDVTVYDTIVPGVASARYVVLYIPDEMRDAEAVDAASDCIRVPFHALSVVSNNSPAYASPECRDLARRVRTALVDTVVSADGASPARVVMEGVNPPQPDELTPDKKVFIQAQFSLQSVAI